HQGIHTPLVFPHVEAEAPLIGVTVRRIDGYPLPLLVYRSSKGWLLLAGAPSGDFRSKRLQLDSTIWETVAQKEWHWSCPSQTTTCAFWENYGMVFGIVSTLPPEQVKQLVASK
ncbi:MAG: hypothetical protein NZ949_03040, partial [Candidatus Kapabacteria bacterium]|nr:hypothetical protein [Candidatus Kapabacteria bacterium]MDW7996887.1 hypothetical protein [Bacteroidota bacterium]